jgi:ATP-binding cassette subfamily C (CFTR/MRP) protein 1
MEHGLSRVHDFFKLSNVQSNFKTQLPKTSEIALQIKGNFTWGFKSPQDLLDLKNLDFKVNKGEFVCVIGDVGSGKSSLLSAINGEMLYVPNDLQVTANSL